MVLHSLYTSMSVLPNIQQIKTCKSVHLKPPVNSQGLIKAPAWSSVFAFKIGLLRLMVIEQQVLAH